MEDKTHSQPEWYNNPAVWWLEAVQFPKKYAAIRATIEAGRRYDERMRRTRSREDY